MEMRNRANWNRTIRIRAWLTVFICGSLLLFHSSLSAAPSDGITARSAVIMDGEQGRILYAKNPGLKQSPASTTKLVTAMVVIDHMDPDAVITVSRKAARTESVRPKLREGERFLVRDLLFLALMRSVNGAAVALAEGTSGSEKAFVRLMNKKVVAIGAGNTRFINASGLPGRGQYITALDLARIMKQSLGYPLIRKIINTKTKEIVSSSGRRIAFRNTNKLLWGDDDLLGGKTGYTRAARHCLAFAVEKGDTTLIAVVLGEKKRSSLWQNSRKLLSRGYSILRNKLQPVIYFNKLNKGPLSLVSKSKKHTKNRGDRKVKRARVASKKKKRISAARIATKRG